MYPHATPSRYNKKKKTIVRQHCKASQWFQRKKICCFTGIISDHRDSDVGIGSNDGNCAVVVGQKGEHRTLVLEEDDALLCRFQGQLLVSRCARILRTKVPIRLGRRLTVEHPEPHLHSQCVHQSTIDVRLLQLASIHGLFRVHSEEWPAVQVQAFNQIISAFLSNRFTIKNTKNML